MPEPVEEFNIEPLESEDAKKIGYLILLVMGLITVAIGCLDIHSLFYPYKKKPKTSKMSKKKSKKKSKKAKRKAKKAKNAKKQEEK